MNARTIQVMAVVALAVAGAAWWSTRTPEASSPKAASAGTLFFPDLAKSASSVQKVTVQAKGATFTLEKQGEGWGMAEKGGYAVNFDKVKDVVAKLAYFQILEKKTDRAELLSKLELEDPAAADAKSTRVTLSDATGKALADVVLGKSAGGGGPTLASMYVRRPDENQAFEVKGSVYVDASPNNWLDKQVVKLERTRVHRVETVQGDGSKLVIQKSTPDDKNFAVLDLPAGAELKWPGVADGTAGALEYLNFDDVDAAGKVDFTSPATVTTTLRTFDGLLVTARILEKEGKFYGSFSARFDPAARVEVTKIEPPPAAGPEQNPTDPAAPPPAPIETKYVPGKTAEEVAKEATELEARLSKWTYVIPGYAASNLSKKMADMLKEVGPPVGPEGAAGPEGAVGTQGLPTEIVPPPANSGGGGDAATPPAAGTDEPKPASSGGGR